MFARLTLFVALGLFTLACDSGSGSGKPQTKPEEKNIPEDIKTISIMEYNVENLFDTVHDEGKEDYTYLPRADKQTPEIQAYCNAQTSSSRKKDCFNLDWNQTVLDEKLKRIANTILQYKNKGADILMFEEVENLNVLTQLRDKFLPDYRTVSLIEGQDERGIDVGVISRFPLAKPANLHEIEFAADGAIPLEWPPKTRGILEVPLKLENGDTLTAYVVHFPSQSNPVSWRIDATRTLLKLLARHNDQEPFVAGGDFNIPKEEDATTGLYSKVMAEKVLVSHLVGCQSCDGTYFYKNSWSFLDALLFPKSFLAKGSKYQLNVNSIAVLKGGQYQVNNKGVPVYFNPYNLNQPLGVADHLPMFSEIIVK